MKDKKILYGTFIALLLLLTTGLSYAYFSSSVSGNDNAKDMVVEVGTLKLTYTDSPEIVMQNIKPGQTITKKVTVKNTGTLDTVYNLVWQELNNTITNDEMVISSTCKRLNSSNTEEGTCEEVEETPIKENIIKKKVSIESGITHEYNVTITFKETNAAQNYNQGKTFSGVLGIGEYEPTQFEKDSWSTIITNVKAGNISNYNVGDTKEVDLGTTYGTHTLRIANTSTPSECSTSGFSQTACGFVLEFEDTVAIHEMNPAGEYNGTQYDGGYNIGGWPNTTMRTFVNNEIYNALPTELKNGIIDTTVVSSHGSEDSSNFTSTDKLYLLSTAEIWEQGTSNTIDYDTAKDVTRQLDYYKNEGVTTSNYRKAIKKYDLKESDYNMLVSKGWLEDVGYTTFLEIYKTEMNGSLGSWLRSAYSIFDSHFFFLSSYGLGDSDARYGNGVAPSFRIG